MPSGSAGIGYGPSAPGGGGGGGGYAPFPSFPIPGGGGGGGGSNPLYEAHHDDPLWHAGHGAYGWGDTPGEGGGPGGIGSGPQPPAPSELHLDAKTNPYLEELVGRERGYLDDLENGTGRIMDITAGRLRDAREGGRKAVSNSAAFRGVDDAGLLGDYDAETTRGEQSALADVSTGREALRGSALAGALSIYGAPAADARAQNAQNLAAWDANNDANMGWWNATNMVGQQNFSNWVQAIELQNKMMNQPGLGVPSGY